VLRASTIPVPLGTSFRAVFEGCDPVRLDASEPLERAARAACAAASLTVVGEARHHYAPHGWTLLLILKESHLAVHTWPEHGAAVVELFSCRPGTPADALLEAFASELSAQRSRLTEDSIHAEK
jgi:S-adenosylmethionine decarboxylase